MGRQLAMTQMRLVAARLLSEYRFTLAPGFGNEDATVDDMKDQLTANPGKLMLVFEKL